MTATQHAFVAHTLYCCLYHYYNNKVAATTQVDGVVKEEEGQEEASAIAPLPLLSASEEDTNEKTSVKTSQDVGAGCRFFKLHLKSPTGWQLDAQVTPMCNYAVSPWTCCLS